MISLRNSLHLDKLRWLFWLRWKMFLRGFTRASGRVSYLFGISFQFLFGIIIGGGIGVGSYFAYRYLNAPVNAEVLFLVLTGVYLIWLVLPLFEFSVNEGLDLSKLVLFPLTRLELMASLLFSTLLDIPMLGLLLVLAAVVVGWAFTVPLALFTLLTMLIFYAQAVGMSQFVLALLARILHSRRFRDLSVILFILFSSSCYIFQQIVVRSLGSADFLNNLRHTAFSPYLQWLPPGMAARAIQQASVGNWGMGLLWLAGLFVVTVAVLYLWQLVVERGLTSAETSNSATRARRQQVLPSQAAPATFWERIIPAQMLALIIKDLKYYRRDPQMLALLVQSVFSMLILLAVPLFNSGSIQRLNIVGPWVVMIAPLYILLSFYSLSFNVLAFERQSLTALFMYPMDPKRILWAKNLVVLAIGFVEVTLVILVAAYVSHAWDFALPAFVVGIAGIGVVLAIGNFTSVFFPMRVRLAQRGFQTTGNTSPQNGCLRGVMSLGTLVVMLLMLLPVALALVLPVIEGAQWIWVITIPASLAYGIVVYAVVTALVAPRILKKAPEILAAVTKE